MQFWRENFVMGIIEKRRSIRNFQSKKIEREKIEVILAAGLQAPSPKNRQPWRFLVIIDEKRKLQLVASMRDEICRLYEKKPDRQDIYASFKTINIIEQAPVLVLVCYEYGMIKQHDDGVNWMMAAKDIEAVELQSIGAAVENMLLKAEELEIGGLWCGDILYAYNTLSKYSDLPVVSAVCLGYKNEVPPTREKKTVFEKCTFV